MKQLNKILWGIVLVAAGVIFALNAMGVADIDIFFDGWWTLFIIIPCLVGLITERRKTGNLVGLCVGVVLLLACQDFISFALVWKLLIPAVIVIVGLKLIFGDLFNRGMKRARDRMKEKGIKANEYIAAFSGQDLIFAGEPFSGADLTAVFGGIKCDLRGALISEDVVINICSIFGGVDVLVPDNVNIRVSSNSIFGGVSDKSFRPRVDGQPTIYINGNCIFGGADIK